MTDTDTQSATPGGAPTEVGHTHLAAQVELAWSDVGETIEDVQDTMRHSWVIAGVSAGSVFAASALVAPRHRQYRLGGAYQHHPSRDGDTHDEHGHDGAAAGHGDRATACVG
ncbi:MAG: hypothetical protein WBM01_15100 [Mycobacterium sp.]